MNNLSLKHSLFNRIVSFILCGVMALCGIGGSVFAENGSMPSSLNSEAKYSFLEKLGIFNNVGETELGRETVVSREILALLYARLSYQESSLSHISGSTNINDLDKESPFYPYVCLAVDNGVMSAAEGKFNPSGNALYSHIIKVLVCMLGYGEQAQLRGGFPVGFMAVAKEQGITGSSKYIDSEVRLLDIAELLYNSLEASIAVKTGDGGIQENIHMNFMELFGIKKTSGLINANSLTNIYSENDIKEGFIQLDKKLFGAGETDIESYVGAEANVWYRESNDIKTVFFFTAKSPLFSEQTLNIGDINEVVKGSDGITLEMEKSGKRIKISMLAREFYNGVYAGGADLANDLEIIKQSRSGSVVLYDNSGSGVYDTVKINYYKTYVAKRADSDNRLYLKDADIEYLDLSGDDADRVTVIRNGKAALVSEICENDIVEYGASKNGRVITVIVTGETAGAELINTVEGRLCAIKKKNTYAIFDIDGLIYETTVDFWTRNRETIVLGYNYTFYLNSSKKIAYISDNATGEKYGYLIGLSRQKGLENEIRFKILTDENKIAIYEAAENVAVTDGEASDEANLSTVNVKSLSALMNCSCIYSSSENRVKRQIIKYFVNDWGKISKIQTARPNFEFECIPVTEYNDDGSLKTATNSAEYSENDFIIKSIERINPLKTRIYTNVSGNNGGRVPINVLAPKEIADKRNCLEMNWTNFDIGKYIADDQTFSFGKYKVDGQTGAITGIVRNSAADSSDALGNVPGHIESDLSVHRLVDYKYVMTQQTVVFSVPGDIDANGNVSESKAADESRYKAMKMTVPGTEKFWFMHLYDIKKDYSVGAAVYIDNSAFEYGAKLYQTRGIVETEPEYVLGEDGTEKLKITLRNYNNAINEYICESDDLKDEGRILRYYTQDGYAVGAGSIVYEGAGDARSGKTYNYVYGAYEGNPITDLKIGAFISVAFNSKGEVNGFFTYFDGDTTRRYYEDEPSGTDKFLNDNNLIKRANANGAEYTEKSYPYGNYTRKTIMGQTEISQNMASTNFSYGKVKAVGAYYVVIETNMPSFSYFDRLGSNNGSHSLYYRTEEGDIFRPIERVLQVKGQTNVFRISENHSETTVSKTTLNDVQAGDIVYAYQPQWEYSGFLAVIK